MKLYIAGKVSKESKFGTHHWRDEFCTQLAELSGLKLEHLDPLAGETHTTEPQEIFAKDCRLIQACDALVVYLSDDISVGGSQEILIARYFYKPVIALAPKGGKFNGAKREMFGKNLTNYKDPFVFSTCDFVCDDIQQVADTLKDRLQGFSSSGLAILGSIESSG